MYLLSGSEENGANCLVYLLLSLHVDSLPACLAARSSILKWILEIRFNSFSHWAVQKNFSEAVLLSHLYICLACEFGIKKQG